MTEKSCVSKIEVEAEMNRQDIKGLKRNQGSSLESSGQAETLVQTGKPEKYLLSKGPGKLAVVQREASCNVSGGFQARP